MFENVDGRTDEGRRTDGLQSDWKTISSPMSLRLRGANKLSHLYIEQKLLDNSTSVGSYLIIFPFANRVDPDQAAA